ncbi:hypothetical protein QBC35DRAFT_498712 [Podospora australis]|uniref:Uncharacterized protein n=1 Tax=Podospora australis TaxID=1536484 RepID=A0AAN6WSN4_9PEZI|nr:hypothetical protein QBC35DRAFT_498712 [Podospora australis]
MSQARVDIAPRPNQYGNHVTPTQIQQPTSNGRHPLPQERYGGSQDPRASAPPPTQWVSGGQSAQQAHSRPPVAYASGPPSLAGSIAVMNVINANRDKMASHSSASPSGRDLAPIMATSSARPVQHDSIPAKRKVPNGDDGANGLSAKRSRYDIASGTDGRRSVSSSTTKPTDRTISFDEVYRDGAPEYKHIIIQFPDGGDFYILRCDEHGVHFGEHPLRGAAKHLASAQHGRMSKEHTKAVETLGCIVLGCTPELMEKNNTMVKKSFEDGYKPFNANQLSKTARAMKGYPQLDKQGLPIPDSAQRPTKKFSGVAKAKPGELYVALHPDDQKSYPVLILPWTDGNLSAVGMEMTLEEAGLFHLTLPRCFDYIHGVETVQGIKGWAAGYQDGGVYMKQREFPCVYIVDKDTKHWTFGWIEAKNLSPFDFSDAKRADLPGFDAAREYYATNVNKFESWKDMEAHRQATAAQQPTAADLIGPSPVVRAGRQPLPNSRPVKDKDVEMTGVAHPDDSDQESDQDSSGNSTTNSDNDVEMANVDSRRTSVSNRDDSSSTAKLIAAQAVQALSLQNSTPATSSVPARAPDNVPKPGFVAVNSPGFVAVNSRSAASSPGPSSRPPVAGQGSGTHQGFERRRVEKIHASSKRVSQQATAAAATTTPSSPAVQAATLPAQTTQASPDVAVRKPSPASLQHILHDSDAPEEARTKSTTGPRQPTISPQPLSSIVVKTNVQGVLARPDRAESVPVRQSESGEKDADQPRSSSLTPIPLATPSTPAFTSNSTGRLQLPSVQPLPSQQRYPTPLSSATESAAGKTQLPALAFPRPNEMSPAQSEVVTPTVSVINSRSNSPVVASVAAPIKSEFNPEADVFAVVKVQEDGADLFVSTPQVQQLFIEDDHRSGVIKAAGSTPENVRSFTLDPKLMKSATRTQGQTMDTTVQILMNDGKTFTLVFETAKLDAFRSENGRVQARRFCRRLMAWNRSVECPSVVEGEGKPQL